MSARGFIVVAFIGLAVVAVLTTALRHPATKTQLTVIAPRDLHDSGPIAARQTPLAPTRTKAKKKAARRSEPPRRRSDTQKSSTLTGAQTRPVPSRKRPSPKTRRERRPKPQRPGTPPPAPNPPAPPPKPCPPVTATVPAPVTVTTPLIGINC